MAGMAHENCYLRDSVWLVRALVEGDILRLRVVPRVLSSAGGYEAHITIDDCNCLAPKDC